MPSPAASRKGAGARAAARDSAGGGIAAKNGNGAAGLAAAPAPRRAPPTPLVVLPCPSCGGSLRLVPLLAGHQIRCLSCRAELAVKEAGPGGGGGLTLEPSGSTRPCPNCANPLRLVPQLDGRQIRCRSCGEVLDVSARPWRLAAAATPVRPAAPVDSASSPRPAAESLRESPGGASKQRAQPAIPSTPPVKRPQPARRKPSSSPAESQPKPPSPEAAAGRAPPEAAAAKTGIGESEILAALGLEPAERGGEDGWEVFALHLPEPPGEPRESPAARAAADALKSLSGCTAPEAEAGESRPDAATAPSEGAAGRAPSQSSPQLAETSRKPERTLLKIDKPSAGYDVLATSASGPIALAAIAAAVVLGLLAAGGWGLYTLVATGPLHPHARYLPESCAWFASLNWREVEAAGKAVEGQDLPGLALVDRCRVFLNNAGLGGASVARVNAGRPPDDTDLVLVFELAEPIDPGKLMEAKAFQQYKQETVRGIPVYTFGRSALAFPEATVVVNGEANLVRGTLRRRGKGFRRPPSELLETVDFAAASVALSEGIPRRFQDSFLAGVEPRPSSVRGTIDRFQYGPTIELRRVFCFLESATAGQVEQTLRSALTAKAKAPDCDRNARQILSAVKVDRDENNVRVELTWQKGPLPKACLETIHQLF